MNDYQQISRWLLPLAFIAGGIIFGIIFEKLILTRLRRIVERTKWEGDIIIITAIRGMTFLWFVVGGVYGAVQTFPIHPVLLTVVHKVLLVTLILSVTIVLAKVSVGFVDLYAERVEGVMPSTTIFENLTRVIIFIIGILVILQSLGISITPILTALGVGGLAVALALQETLSNLFSGVQIIASRQLKPGDYVKLESGEEGYVEDITWRNTVIRALPNNMIVVPNSKLASTIVVNYYQPERELAVLVPVGVSYDSDLEKVEKVTIDVANEVMREVQGGIPEFEPFIRYNNFGDFSIDFTVIMRANEFVDQYLIKHEFIKRLHKRFEAEGIEIPFPVRTVYVKGKE